MTVTSSDFSLVTKTRSSAPARVEPNARTSRTTPARADRRIADETPPEAFHSQESSLTWMMGGGISRPRPDWSPIARGGATARRGVPLREEARSRPPEVRENDMRRLGQQVIAVVTTLSFLFLMVQPALAADPDMDRLVRGPAGKDWVTNGGNLTNQRYSTLQQIDTTNVAQLKGAWMTRLKGSGAGGKYSFEGSPLVKDGIMYIGISGGEFGVTGRLTALDAKSGAILWRSYTLPAPGERGSETWPPGTDHSMRGGATIWNTPALDPDLGLVYFVTGNCGPDYDGSMREGDNLYCASMMALKAKTGEYVWHFQQVHHDIWDYDA